MAPSVTYLGHLIDAAGLHPLPEKVRAIQEVPTPRNVSELKSYLGLFDVLFKVPTQPFHKVGSAEQAVESKGQVGMEKPQQEEAFQESKKLLVSSQLLVHFDPNLPITLACDASNYGIGAVLAHTLPDGSEKPIAYASRTLNSNTKFG